MIVKNIPYQQRLEIEKKLKNKLVKMFGLRDVSMCDSTGCKVEYRREAYGFTVVFSRRKSVTPQVTPQVTQKLEKLLAFCVEPKSLQEMMQLLELTDRKHFRRKYLNPLLKSGIICMTMPDKPQSSQQKYIATNKIK